MLCTIVLLYARGDRQVNPYSFCDHRGFSWQQLIGEDHSSILTNVSLRAYSKNTNRKNR